MTNRELQGMQGAEKVTKTVTHVSARYTRNEGMTQNWVEGWVITLYFPENDVLLEA
jgi:hypothetical protein